MAINLGDEITLTDLIDDMEYLGIVTVKDGTVDPEEYIVSVQALGKTVRVDSSGKVIK